MSEWQKIEHGDGEVYENPTFTDEPLDVVVSWRKNNAEQITVLRGNDGCWVTYSAGGMNRLLEDFEDEDAALERAEELCETY